ncbi:MAG: gamma-glutamyltransferase, partial [Candidatus Binatia bacterium]
VYGLVGSEANSIMGGKRPLSSMSPTIVVRDGAAILAVGASGGPLIITSTLQTLINVLDFSMNIGDAVSAPRIHQQWLPDVVGVEETMPAKVLQGIRRRGHTVNNIKRGGAVQAVLRKSDGGDYLLTAVSDPRKGGTASAW